MLQIYKYVLFSSFTAGAFCEIDSKDPNAFLVASINFQLCVPKFNSETKQMKSNYVKCKYNTTVNLPRLRIPLLQPIHAIISV